MTSDAATTKDIEENKKDVLLALTPVLRRPCSLHLFGASSPPIPRAPSQSPMGTPGDFASIFLRNMETSFAFFHLVDPLYSVERSMPMDQSADKLLPRSRYDLIVPLKKARRDGPRTFTNMHINRRRLVENDDENIEDKMITVLNLFYDDANLYRGLRTHDSAGRVANELSNTILYG